METEDTLKKIVAEDFYKKRNHGKKNFIEYVIAWMYQFEKNRKDEKQHPSNKQILDWRNKHYSHADHSGDWMFGFFEGATLMRDGQIKH